jgi:NADH:ubiquinone reductase (H+-translocating)
MKIVILGAGYAGLRTAMNLEKLVRAQRMDHTITLVDQNPYHQLIQELHHLATNGIDSLATIYDIDGLIRGRQIEFIRGQVNAIDPLARTVQLIDGQSLPYERLVIALGSITDFHDIPGAPEHSLPLRTYPNALAIRDHIIAQFKTAPALTDPKQQRIALTTAIVGGGYTGCQLAGELSDWIVRLCHDTGAPRSEVRIALLDRHDVLLHHFDHWANEEAKRVLDRRRVSIYLNIDVQSVEPQLLRISDGRVLRAGTIVWAAGIRAPDLIAAAGLPTDKLGRAIVDRYLRVTDQEDIFALGDCAAIPAGLGDEMIPSTASYAMRQGEHMAEALFDDLSGRAPRAYEPLKLGELVSLGSDDGVGNPLGMPVTGYPIQLLKKGIEQFYRRTIESA